MEKLSIKSRNRPTNAQLSFSVMFLTALVIFAIASIGVAVADVAGVFFASVLCILLTMLAVLAVAMIHAEYR